MLLNSVIRLLNIKMENRHIKSEQITAPQINNVKLQLEQITPVLCGLLDWKQYSEQNAITDVDVIQQFDQTVNTYCAVMVTLSTIAGNEDWVEIVCKQVG